MPKAKDQRGEGVRLFALRTLQIITILSGTRLECEWVFGTRAQ